MISFEWDQAIAESNLEKHAVSFEIASTIFADPRLVIKFDRDKDGEKRWHAIGRAPNGGIIQAAYTWRGNERIRIISARKANRREKEIYA